MLGLGAHFLLALLWIFALYPSKSEAIDTSQRCHIDSNLHWGRATSRGKWMDITYNIVYHKGLCEADKGNCVLDATINGINQTLGGSKGSIIFENIALVRFNLTSDSKGKNIFFSELCWSSFDCTTLCSYELLGTTSSCVVKNIGVHLIIIFIVLVPLAICLVLLYIYSARLKLGKQKKVTEINDNHQHQALPRSILKKQRDSLSNTTLVHIKPPYNGNDASTHLVQASPATVEIPCDQSEIRVLAEEHPVQKGILKKGSSDSFPSALLYTDHLLQDQQRESLLTDGTLPENIISDTQVNDGTINTLGKRVVLGREMSELHDIDGFSRHAMDRAEEVARLEVERAEEAAELVQCITWNNVLGIYAAEQRAFSELMEAEESARLEVDDAEGIARCDVEEAAWYDVEGIALRDVEMADTLTSNETPLSDNLVVKSEDANNPRMVVDVIKVECIERARIVAGERQSMLRLEAQRKVDWYFSVSRRFCRKIMQFESEEEIARDVLIDEEESDRDSIFAKFTEQRLILKMMDETTEVEERMLSASKWYNNEYKWRMLKMAKPPPNVATPVPFIGFSLAEFRGESFLKVGGLYENGPAYQAGIRIGDILLEIEGMRVTSINEARRAVSKYCRVAELTDMTLKRSDGTMYNVSLWIMTAESRFKDEPYFFDLDSHTRYQRQWRTDQVVKTPEKS
ncbi:PDZ domain 6 [Trypanosoma melophagium]|uniref:PDZ domain 6 n=1 Tax=Trypanosoma melophagium TaxID=715481 RepID=UPI00351A5585|nr:PDZ domain 6 [Trypanosoma melophagium]